MVRAETDEEMARRLQREFDALSSSRSSRSVARPRAKPKKKGRRREEEGEEGESTPKRRRVQNDSFNKELVLRCVVRCGSRPSLSRSDALVGLLGEARLSRPQVVKRIWVHVKAHDLQDPSDKRYLICDEPMRAVFHTDRLHMFTWVESHPSD